VGAAAGGANYKTHPKMPKNAVKIMTNQWNVANLHNQIPNGFPISKGFAPPQLRCRGDRFFPLSVPEGARRGDGARLFRTAPLRAKQSSQNAASGGKSIGRSSVSFQHFCQINIFLRRWSKSPNKKSCHYFWSFKVHWGVKF
jgi:hypothetical protein